jgi:hypothetical protein
LCRLNSIRSHLVQTRSTTIHPSPKAPSGKTPAPINQLSTTQPAAFRKNIRNLPGARTERSHRCPERRCRSTRKRPVRTSIGRCLHDSFPNESFGRALELFRSRVAYMPSDQATGKGNIYNLAGNVQSGSQAEGDVGKMCKKGKIERSGLLVPAGTQGLKQ